MTTSSGDGSRIEAAEAGIHAEEREVDESGAARQHVTATDAAPRVDPHDVAEAHGHDVHDDHDGGHGGGHGADPNAGVVVGTPPTSAWVITACVIGLITIVAAVLLAVAITRA
jgi:hypothetical protein